MPELPEVETIRRQLEPDLNGRMIEVVEVLDPYFTKPESPERFERAAVAAIPDGVYTAEGCIDNDGNSDDPCWVRLSVEIRGDQAYHREDNPFLQIF